MSSRLIRYPDALISNISIQPLGTLPMRKARLAVVVAAVFVVACDNPEQKANALFVEAAQALTTAHATADILQQYDQLTAARQTVTGIVDGHPGSSAAVRISANEKIGPYSLAELNAAIAALAQRPELCLRTLTQGCLTDMVLTNLDTLLKLDRSQKPDESVLNIAIGGLPFANIVAHEKVQALFANSPAGIKGNTELMGYTFGYPPMTPHLLRMVGSVKGEQGVTDAVVALHALPGFQDMAVKEIDRLAYFFLNPREPDSARILRATADAIMKPLPEQAAQNLSNQICKLSIKEDENTIIVADCTPAEMAVADSYFGYVSTELMEQIYEAAPPDKKQNIARSIYSGAKALEDRITWNARTKSPDEFDTLVSFYVQATREGHRARPDIIKKLETAKEKDLGNLALTQAGLTPKNIVLLHINGTLTQQLPVIYQSIEAQPGFSYQLFRVLECLTDLQPHTPGMDLTTLQRVVGTAISRWPDNESAHKNVLRRKLLYRYPADADPRPVYDILYAGERYARDLGLDTLLRFKAHGHTDIFDAAVAASKPEDEVQSLRFKIARTDVLDSAKAGDIPAALAKLEALPFITRYYIIGHSMQDEELLPKATRDALLAPLLEKYAYELTSFELGWKVDLRVPVQTKLDTITAHYGKITEFIGESPADWLMQSFRTFTPAQRLQALTAMHKANDKLWPVYASAIALVNG